MTILSRFAGGLVVLVLGWTALAAARPTADEVTLTFTNSTNSKVEVFLTDGPISDSKGKIEGGKSATFKSPAKAVWKFMKVGDETEFDQYTATAAAQQTYTVHPANQRIAAVMKQANSKAGLTVILRADTKGQLEGGERQVLVAEDGGPGSWLRVAPIEQGEKARFRWKLVPASPDGFQLVSDPEGLVVGVARSGELAHLAPGSRDGLVFTFVPTPNGQGMALAVANRPGTIVVIGKPVSDSTSPSSNFVPRNAPAGQLPVSGFANVRWHPRVELVTKDSQPPTGHTFAAGAANAKFPVLEVEPLSLGNDAPPRDPKAPRSAEFASWVNAETASFAKPTNRQIAEAGAAGQHGLNIVACARFGRMGYHVMNMNPLDLQENGLLSRGKPLFKHMNTNASGNYYYAGDIYRTPIDLLVKHHQKSSVASNSHTYFGSKDLQTSFGENVQVGASGGAYGVSASVKAGIGTNSSAGISDSKKTVTVIKEKYAHEFWLVLNKERAQIDPQTAERLMDVALGRITPDTFYTERGTHYPLAQLFGGRAIEETKMTEESAGSSLSKSLSMNVGVSVSGSVAGVSAGASVDYKRDESEAINKMVTESREKTRTYAFGGNGTEFASWSLGAAESFIPIKVYLRPVGDVVHPELATYVHDTPTDTDRKLTDADALLLHRARAVLTTQLDVYLKRELAKIAPGGEPKSMPLEIRLNSITPTTLNFGGKSELTVPPGLTISATIGSTASESTMVSILHLRNTPGQQYKLNTPFRPSLLAGAKPDAKWIEVNGKDYQVSPGVFRFWAENVSESNHRTVAVGASGTASVGAGQDPYRVMVTNQFEDRGGYGSNVFDISELVKAPGMRINRKISFNTTTGNRVNAFAVDLDVTFQKADISSSHSELPALEALESKKK